MSIEKQLNAMIEEAKVKATKSGVSYGCVRGEINSHKVETSAIGASNCRSFRVTWLVDEKRCKVADLLKRIKAN